MWVSLAICGRLVTFPLISLRQKYSIAWFSVSRMPASVDEGFRSCSCIGDPLGDPSGDPSDESLGDPLGDPSDESLGDPSGDPLDESLGDPLGVSGDPSDESLGDPLGEAEGVKICGFISVSLAFSTL